VPFRRLVIFLTLVTIAASALVTGAATPARADGCAGAAGCPYLSVGVVGQRAEGVLRFPQAIALGPGGNVYVGDQLSHAVQVFGPTGAFLGEFGGPGRDPGQLGAVGGVAVDANGSVFVADSADRIDHFAPDGSLLGAWGRHGSRLGQFNFGTGSGNAAGAGGGLAVAGGFVYVADTRNNRVQRFALDGSNPVLLVSPPGRLAAPQGIAVSSTNIFVADDQHHRVAVFGLDGALQRAIGLGRGAGPGQLQNPYDVALDGAGRVYVADDANHRVVRFGVGQLEYPRAVAADAAGNTYVADTANDRIVEFDPGGRALRTFGTSGRAPGQFTQPEGAGADASGLRAVADSADGRVEVLAPDGSVAAIWGSAAPGPTLLSSPSAVAFGPDGTAYVADERASVVVAFDRAGHVLRRIGRNRLSAPSGLATDAAGNLYVADTGDGRIARFAPTGAYTGSLGQLTDVRAVAVTPDGSRIYAADAGTNRIVVLGPDGSQLGQFGGLGKAPGHFNSPRGIALDPAGDLWVADYSNNRVQRLDPSGQPLAVIGERGTGAGQFWHPGGVSVDCTGLLTVSDTGNNRVQQFTVPGLSATTCVPLPPVSTPPGLNVWAAPPAPPDVSLRTLRRTAVVSQGLAIRVGCDLRCTIRASATIAPDGKLKRHQKRVALTASARGSAAAGGARTLVLRLSRSAQRKLLHALGRRRGLLAQLHVTATSSTGQPTIVNRRLHITR